MRNLRKMEQIYNLVQFQTLHFFVIVQAPLSAPGDGKHVKVPVQEIADGKYLWASCKWLIAWKEDMILFVQGY